MAARAVSYDWRQPLLAGYDSGGSIGTALGTSSTDKSLPYVNMAASPTSAIAVTAGAVTSSSPVISVNAVAHGLATGDYVRITGTTTTPASGANGLFNVTVVDADNFTITTANNFTVTSASIGGTYSKCTGTSREFAVKFDTVPATGSFLYYLVKSQAFTLTIWESTDSITGASGSGTWTQIAHSVYSTPGVPANTGRETNASECGGVQATTGTTAGWKAIRFTNFDNTATADFLMCAGKQVGGGVVPDLCLNMGSSLIQQDVNPRVMRKVIQLKNSSRDPIYVKCGVAGGKVSDYSPNMFNTYGTWGVAPGYILSQCGPNDYAAGRPYSSDSSQTRYSTALTTSAAAIESAWPSTPVFLTNGGHNNATGIPAVNDLANTENGIEPYNDNDVNPYIRDNSIASNWSTTYARPNLDEQVSFSLFPPATFFFDTTTHPAAFQYQHTYQWYKYIDDAMFDTPRAYVSDVVYFATNAGAVPSWYKTRLETIYGTILTGSVSSLSTSVSALATTYVEPSGTKPTDSGATAPLLIWMDPPDFGTVTQSGGTGVVTDMVEKSSNAGTFTQATAGLRPTYNPPNPENKYGMICAVNGGSMPCNNSGGGATIISGLDTVSQNFQISMVLKSFGGNATGAFFGWGVSTTSTKFGLQVTGTDELGQSGSGQFRIIAATAGLPNGTTVLTAPADLTGYFTTGQTLIMSITYDGTTLKLRKNGVEIASAAWAKPAWTADRFYLYGNAASTSRMSAKAGDFICRTGYNTTDLARDELYLTNKWADITPPAPEDPAPDTDPTACYLLYEDEGHILLESNEGYVLVENCVDPVPPTPEGPRPLYGSGGYYSWHQHYEMQLMHKVKKQLDEKKAELTILLRKRENYSKGLQTRQSKYQLLAIKTKIIKVTKEIKRLTNQLENL